MSPGPKPFRGPPSPASRRRSAVRAPRLMAAPAAPPRARQGAGSFRGPSAGLGGPGPCWPPAGPPQAAVTLLGSPEACRRRNLDMARELRPGQARPGPKRQRGTVFCNYDLDYELYREDAPYRMSEYQRIPPLINRVPVKVRRTHVSGGLKSSFSPHRGSKNSHLPQKPIKLRPEELQVIRGELSQIKAQVDSLLENLERMEQQREQPAGLKDSEENRGAGNEESSCATTEPPQDPGNREHTEPQGQSTAAEAAGSQSTEPEEQ
ncbi:uncharacterized protein LOC142431850 isoform X2 [Tenrec ecaudatus]|uniref:uncharacterized protein LOC142431850 isoform X2 n=1 Tax=Tenrec ecaudatus TaxID=94439 RepID=UPI003F59D17B